MAASHGFEPRLTESESAVLPLDDEAIGTFVRFYIPTKFKMQTIFKKLFTQNTLISKSNNYSHKNQQKYCNTRRTIISNNSGCHKH